jgi:uncharacterized membrane protein YkvA (DUF1232 family)
VIPLARFIQRWKQWAGQLKTEVYAIYVAYRDPRVPWVARVFAMCVVAYAFSPIDLIPDPIPILGYLDDLILIPLGIKLALSMIPAEVMAESREKAREIMRQGKPVNRAAAAVIAVIWLVLAALIITVLVRVFSR